MSCNNLKCGCDFNIKTVGVCDVSRLNIDGTQRQNLNWTQISVPEILCVPEVKPDMEAIDQVYANIVLKNTKLIETPFAYRRYTLFSFFNSVTGITATLPGLITTLTGAVTALITPALDTTILTAFNTLEAALQLLIAVPGVPALIATVNGMETTITNLITSINDSIAAVSLAADNLLLAIATVPFSADAICAAIQALISSLNALNTIVSGIVTLLTDMLDTLDAAALAIGNPAVTLAVGAATAVLDTLINVTIPPLVTAINTAILAILALLAPVDCTNAYAFEIIPNAEGTCLSGRKLIIEGVLKQKLVYTAEVDTQSVHSAHFAVPFIAFIIPYAKFEGAVYQENIEVYDPETGGPIFIDGFLYDGGEIIVDLCEEFNIEKCIEDIYVLALDARRIFKNVTIFLKATAVAACV